MNIPYLRADNLLSIPAIAHGFFTRNGGVSQGLYTSLNVCPKPDWDNPAHVKENERRIVAQWPGKINALTFLKQVHGDAVVEATAPLPPLTEGDALITNTPGLLVGVMSADCIPVLISNTTGTWVGAIHAGWKSVAQDLVTKTLDKLRHKSPDSTWVAAIGPCLHQDIFEVGAEVHAQFTAIWPEVEAYFMPFGEKYKLDAKGIVHWQLAKAGVTNVVDMSIDTYTNPTDFFSARYNRHRGHDAYGAQASVIGVSL